MYNKFLFVNRNYLVFFFFLKIIRIRNGKMKFRKCKDWKNVRVRKHKVGKCTGQTDMEKFGNDL